MDDLLYTFEATGNHYAQSSGISILIALPALTGMLLLLLNTTLPLDRNRRLVGAMLLFFVFLIAASTAFFSFWKKQRTGPVFIYADAIETSSGKVLFSELANASIRPDRQPSLINPNLTRKTINMLLLEERNGKVHILTEEDYPIRQILDTLKEVVKDWEK